MRWLDGITGITDITDITELELGQTPGNCEGQGGLAGCSPWVHKETPDVTRRVNSNNTGLFHLT